MNSHEISRALATSLFHFRRCVVVTNVSWGMLPWEADLLVMSGGGFLYEVEIKISIADLKRDARKRKWAMTGQGYPAAQQLRGMWFAMPEKVWSHKDAAAAVPDRAGVIVVKGAPGARRDTWPEIIRPCKHNREARPLPMPERFQLARLGTMRYWARKEAA